jgi:type II secretory pathway pseudopilin PulG
MTALLVVVTLASLAVSGALLVYLLKLSREERERSEARAAALAELLEARGDGSPQTATVPTEPRPIVAAVREPAPKIVDVPLIAFEPFEHADSGEMSRADLFASATIAPAGQHAMRRLLAPAIGIAVVGLALTSVYLWNRPTGVQATAEAAAARPLELVTLRHQRQGDTLIITGLVRNPPDAPAIQGLVALAFAFDKQGTFLTSGRSVLDFPQLKPGEESPFSISIAEADGVGRYRVSFRTDAGIVPHVDRRSAPPAAVQQAAAQ